VGCLCQKGMCLSLFLLKKNCRAQDENHNKLEPKTVSGRLLWFDLPNTKAYKVLTANGVIRRSRDVIVQEDFESKAGVCRPNHPSVYNVYGGISRYGVTKLHPVTGTTKLVTDSKTVKGMSSRNITASEYRHVCQSLFLPEGKKIFTIQGLPSSCLQLDGDPTHNVAKSEMNN
jgi:hypothetical protein